MGRGQTIFKLVFVVSAVSAFYFFFYFATQDEIGLLQQVEPIQNVENQFETQLLRQRQIHRVCNFLELERRQKLKPNDLDHIIVDDEHRILYCYVPKVACTNWKRVLMSLNSKATTGIVDPLSIPAKSVHHASVFRTLDSYEPNEIEFRLENYFKFLFVRHPFERLVSAYRNKFMQNYSVYFQNHFGRAIIQKYRINTSNESLLKGNDVTFNEFVTYLTDPETHQSPLNEHWRPVFELCRPCHITYDVVGKFETLVADAEFVLQKIRMKEKLLFPKKNRSDTTRQIVGDFLKILNPNKVFSLYQLYSLDFKMFGYKYAEYDNYLPG